MEPAFENAGTTPGLEIWRIEDFKPVKYPKDQHGKFYTGDSYIVLHTYQNGEDLSWDIHFWLGSQTSQDESGSAAIFSVLLDEQLGGAPIQYREVQGYESQRFLSYFKNGIRYLPGGVSSGFHHVDKNAVEKKLYQVKGSRNIRVKQVDLSVSSMNDGDCFILDTDKIIYVYQGLTSRRIEKLKAISAATQIRDQDHAGHSKIVIIDELSSESELQEFFDALGGGSRADIPKESVDDEKFETDEEKIVSLYRVSDASGTLKVELVGKKPLQQSLLDPNDCFILDTSSANLFVWVGKHCNNKEKAEAMNKAQHYLTSKNYPKWTHVQRVVEGAEPTAFTQYFATWQSVPELRRKKLVHAASQDNQAFDARLFHAQIRPGTNQFQVEEIVSFAQVDLCDDDVMLLDIGKELFVWIGNGASVKEKAGAKDLALKYLAKHHRDEVPITIINQGQEPASFTEHFPSWDHSHWDNVQSYEEYKAKIHELNKLLH